jgi:hypothetical protein
LSKDTSYKEPVVSSVFGESPGEEPSLLSNKTLSESGSGEESRTTTSEAVDSKLIISDQSKTKTLLQNNHASAAMVTSDHDALTKWIDEPCSPQTEEIHRDKIPESVISLPPTRQATPELINIDT